MYSAAQSAGREPTEAEWRAWVEKGDRRDDGFGCGTFDAQGLCDNCRKKISDLNNGKALCPFNVYPAPTSAAPQESKPDEPPQGAPGGNPASVRGSSRDGEAPAVAAYQFNAAGVETPTESRAVGLAERSAGAAPLFPDKHGEVEWLHRFLNCTVFGPPPSEIQRAHEVVDALSALSATREWISVEDSLPQFNTEVLIAFKDASLPATAQLVRKPGNPGEVEWLYPHENQGDDYDWTVTHWMPLPEHPLYVSSRTDG